MTTLVCTKCGAAFEGKEHRRNKPYCSNLCRYARDKRGEKHHGAKLTEPQVRAIRADRRRHKFIAADYGLHRVHTEEEPSDVNGWRTASRLPLPWPAAN
jgi:hypothetical protein